MSGFVMRVLQWLADRIFPRCFVCRKAAFEKFGKHWYCNQHYNSIRTA